MDQFECVPLYEAVVNVFETILSNGEKYPDYEYTPIITHSFADVIKECGDNNYCLFRHYLEKHYPDFIHNDQFFHVDARVASALVILMKEKIARENRIFHHNEETRRIARKSANQAMFANGISIGAIVVSAIGIVIGLWL